MSFPFIGCFPKEVVRATIVPTAFRLTLALLLSLAASGVSRAQTPGDWADSPEALFLTADERREWAALGSGADREAFKTRYWLRRDPAPQEPGNAFRDVVLGRIRRADERFPLKGTPGSQTARGRAFVLLGTPARVRDTAADRPPAPRPGVPPTSEVGLIEGIETMVVWIYDRERTPALLEAIGRPMLELTFIIEPQRGTDRLQQPGLFNELHETLARRSIVSDVRAAASPDTAPVGAIDTGAREGMAAFTVSPLIVSAGPSGKTSGSALDIFPARTDATFATSESLWAVVELASASDVAAVTLELALRRDNTPVAGTGEQPASPVKIADGRYLVAFQLPLSTLTPGDYVLYAIVRTRTGDDEGRIVRRVPIRLVAR